MVYRAVEQLHLAKFHTYMVEIMAPRIPRMHDNIRLGYRTPEGLEPSNNILLRKLHTSMMDVGFDTNPELRQDGA